MKTFLFHVVCLLVIHHVKGLCADEGCENGNSSKLILAEMQQLFAELKDQQVQIIQELLNTSLQQMRTQQDNVLRSLEAIDRRLHEHDISVKNDTQNSWKLTIGLPVKLEISFDLGEGPVPLPVIGNWIVLMHRFDGSVDFHRNWTDYKNGFGDVTQGEFWLGNEKIHRLTNKLVYKLRIEVQHRATGLWYYADYPMFSLDSEANKYALRLSGFSGGNAGDSLTNKTKATALYLGGMNFSTWDSDNDRTSGSCANFYRAGWWFNGCASACITCQYKRSEFGWFTLEQLSPDGTGQLRAARMMIISK